MEIKKIKILFYILLILLSLPCFSQVAENMDEPLEDEGSFYIMVDEENNTTIVQHFSWEASEDVFMYQFVLEKMNENGEFEEYDVQDIEENFVDYTLSAGEYRYKIGLYNFLDIIEVETPWTEVSIIKAIKPAINDVSPSLVYIDTGFDGEFTVKGKDLSEDISFKLINEETGLVLAADVLEKDMEKNRFTIKIDPLQVEPGTYTLSARNDGGLTFEYSPLTLIFSDNFDICVSLGAAYPLSLQKELMTDYWNWESFSKQSQTSMRYNAHFTFVPFKMRLNYIGFTLNASAFAFAYDYYENEPEEWSLGNLNMFLFTTWKDQLTADDHPLYRILATLYPVNIMVNYQRMLSPYFILDTHIGAGLTLIDMSIEYPVGDTAVFKTFGISATGGVGIQYSPWQHFYMELAGDYTFTLCPTFNIQYFTPAFSLGWRF
ncbi:MAG: hypothetical protein K5930_10610 [Treponemataceae bacterium]|nr:hypothetical protein [Treponemataceae bacterium]